MFGLSDFHIYNNRKAAITTLVLFAAVGLTIGFRAALFGADNGQNDDCRDVGDHLEELVRKIERAELQTDLQSVAETEEQAGKQNAGAAPAAENDGAAPQKAQQKVRQQRQRTQQIRLLRQKLLPSDRLLPPQRRGFHRHIHPSGNLG